MRNGAVHEDLGLSVGGQPSRRKDVDGAVARLAPAHLASSHLVSPCLASHRLAALRLRFSRFVGLVPVGGEHRMYDAVDEVVRVRALRRESAGEEKKRTL